MKSPTAGDLEDCLQAKVDERRQQISQIVEEVQRVVHHLTAEISHQDIRFQAVPYSDTYNGNIKVSRSHLLSKRHPGSRARVGRSRCSRCHPAEGT
ncbi:unnamed protein product, partial [Gulo gulo]